MCSMHAAASNSGEDGTGASGSAGSSDSAIDLCGSSSEDEMEHEKENDVPPVPAQQVKVEAKATLVAKTEGKRRPIAAASHLHKEFDCNADCRIDDERPAKAARSSSRIIAARSSGCGGGEDVEVTGAVDPSVAFAHARYVYRACRLVFTTSSRPFCPLANG